MGNSQGGRIIPCWDLPSRIALTLFTLWLESHYRMESKYIEPGMGLIFIPASLLTDCAALGKMLYLSLLPFSQL